MLTMRAPDGLVDEGKVFVIGEPDFVLADGELPAIYGKNDTYFTIAAYDGENGCGSFGLKNNDGSWNLAYCSAWDILESPTPSSGYGDINCRPIPADYDGDGKDDRAVQCGTDWKIAYSSDTSFRDVTLGQALDPLPSYVYPGGITYQDVVYLFNYYKANLNCDNGKCHPDNNISDVVPPIGPYFAQCVKYWAPKADYCWDK
jgi:hypothetical protein